MGDVGTGRRLMRRTVARLRRASRQQEDRRYASQSGPSNEPPFLQRSFGAGVPRLRSVDQSPVASVFAFFTAFLVLWPAVLAPSFVFSPTLSAVSFVFLPTVSAVSFVFSPTVSAASLVFSPAVSSPFLIVSPAFLAPCFMSSVVPSCPRATSAIAVARTITKLVILIIPSLH